MTENAPEEQTAPAEESEVAQDADELEKKLLDAMRNLRRKNKKIEEYLDSLNRPAEKPAQEGTDAPPP